jgi:hypothetical protein
MSLEEMMMKIQDLSLIRVALGKVEDHLSQRKGENYNLNWCKRELNKFVSKYSKYNGLSIYALEIGNLLSDRPTAEQLLNEVRKAKKAVEDEMKRLYYMISGGKS